MQLNNTMSLNDTQKKQVIVEAKKELKKRGNIASSEMFKITITGAIVRGNLVDNGKVFAISGLVPIEVKTPAAKKPAAKKKPTEKKPTAKKRSTNKK